jgi:hypothetical protein
MFAGGEGFRGLRWYYCTAIGQRRPGKRDRCRSNESDRWIAFDDKTKFVWSFVG